MRVGQRFSETGADPAGGFDFVAAAQEFPFSQGGGIQRDRFDAGGIDSLQQGTAASIRFRQSRQLAQDAAQAGARDILHAQEPLVALGVHRFGKDLNDVIVLQAGQVACLLAAVGRNLQGHQTPQRSLPRQIDLAARARA